MSGQKYLSMREDLMGLKVTLDRLRDKSLEAYYADPEGARDEVLKGIAVAHQSTSDSLQYLLDKER